MANFHVRYYPKDPKSKRMKGHLGDPEHEKTQEAFEKPRRIAYEDVSLSFSVFGLRNLRKEAIKPFVEVRLTNGDGVRDPDTELKNWDPDAAENAMNVDIHKGRPDPTCNPTFGQTVTISGIQLAAEPLLWPFLHVKIYEEPKRGVDHLVALLKGGCEECYTTVSLVDYAGPLGLSAKDIAYAKA